MSKARPKDGPLDIMFTVYVLQSLKDSKRYAGHTHNYDRRINEHNLGRSKSTKYRAPFKLLFKEEYSELIEAKRRELWWKSGSGRRKLKEYFNNPDKSS